MTESHSSAEKGSPEKPPDPRRPGGGTASEKARREKVQRQLDEALADSFPASDPVSIVTSHEEEDWGETQGAVSSSASPA